MGEVFETACAFVKNVTEVFGKTDGERAKCPRCKGSGLFAGQSAWRWLQPSPSNAPCWFCEGMGVMAIGGLNGYMLGRSNAIVNTREIKQRPGMPVNLELFPGKFPESKCKLRSYKPSEGMAQILYDPLSCPAWLHEAEREADLSRSGFAEAAELLPALSEEGSPSWTFMSPEHSGSQHLHRFYARTSTPFSNSKVVAAAAADQSRPDETPSTLPQPSASVWLEMDTRRKEVGGIPFAASHTLNGLLAEHSWSTSADYNTMQWEGLGGTLRSEYSDLEESSRAMSPRRSRSRVRGTYAPQAAQPVKLDSGGVSNGLERENDPNAGNHMLRRSRGHTSSRRPRNRIREEAEKEAEARARRAQQPLTPNSEAPSTTLEPLVGMCKSVFSVTSANTARK